MADSEQHPRLILRNFLSLHLCKELEFIHKSCCTVGYRPNVFSTTLSHLIATNSPHLIMPFVPIRENLKEKVEEFFGCEYELFVEFTGLISWCKGSSIGWHSDDNRDYLKQRDFADGEPSTFAPMAGDVIIYTADNKNVHSVGEITEGERLALTLWFSRDASHDEDAKLLLSLSEYTLNISKGAIPSYFPLRASNNMYWFPPEEASIYESGFDICFARLHVLGFDISASDKESYVPSLDSSCHLKLLEKPLHLVCGDELLVWEFVNILHALQVVNFYNWKASESDTVEVKGSSSINVISLSESQRQKIDSLKAAVLKDLQSAEIRFGQLTHGKKNFQHSFDWISFFAIIFEWEAYICDLQKDILTSLPHWQMYQAIFCLPQS
ncbi:uncharacterized protein LOC142523441 isoform X2 [Primulina tabacum]|uniref:uncharacterized protein LOC142523441 isoform X2 n=1 Tax=Primulina tabacum TaxID=48773 RepID=UPI003F5A9524